MTTARPVIVLDPGHGGHSPVGGSTPDNVAAPGLSERQLTLDLARRVRERLRPAGAVMLTRDSDTNLSLQDRAGFGQMVNADYFVSLHFNAHPDVAHDSTETYVARAAAPGDEELAEALRQSVSAALGTKEGGVFRADLGVLQRTRHLDRTRVALLEACDLSNPARAAAAFQPEFLETLAGAIASAITQRVTVEHNGSTLVATATAADRPFIIETSGHLPEDRAFHPAANDKTGITTISVRVPKLPAGGSIRWSVPPDQRGRIDLAGVTARAGESVEVHGIRAGLSAVDVDAFDAGGTSVESIKFRLSVPQFITINEDKAPFEQALADMHVDHLKGPILDEARRTSEHLLRTANVRLIWQVPPMTETTPAHVPANQVVAVTLRGDPPPGRPGLEGRTNDVGGVFGTGVANETIDIWPGAFDNAIPGGDPTFVDTETNALVVQLASQTISDPAMDAFAIMVIGRLIGETMAHEITHALIGAVHLPAIPDVNDLMEVGGNRSFQQRTGLEDTAHSSPVDPANFIDHGIASIGEIGVGNQGLIDTSYPVPPAFA